MASIKVIMVGAKAQQAVVARPALQLRDLRQVEDRFRPGAVEVELDEEIGSAGDRPCVGQLRLQPERLVEGARSDHLHEGKDTVRVDDVPAR